FSLAEAERKYQEALESNAQLESEKSELMSKVHQLELELQKMQIKFSEMHCKC
ncbi:leucine-rich repeat flightless-interacting protein 2-like, partial [Clarias magur]